jgi:tetratricopeptide (TPR) repeat protein
MFHSPITLTMADTIDWSSKRYLVVDDFSIVHRMLRDMLRKFGAAVIDTAKNGADAVDLLRERQYDVVLCDYMFSEGPNGQQILEEARHRDLVGLSCIWIVVSAEKAVETVMGAAEQAPDGYILKPLTESILLSRLNRAADRKQAFIEIDRAYTQKNFQKAIALCEERLVTNRIHAADLLRMKAHLFMKIGDLASARATFEQAMSIREQVWAKTGLAKIHYLTGNYSPARYLLYEVLKDNPSYLDAYDYLAQTLQKLDLPEEALQVLEKAASLSPYSVMRQKNLGEAAFKLGKIDMAEQAFQMSIEVGENSVFKTPDAYFGLARVYGAKRQVEQSLHVLDEVRQIFDDGSVDQRSKIVEAHIYAAMGRVEQAKQIADELRCQIEEAGSKLDEQTVREMAQLDTAIEDEKVLSGLPIGGAIKPAMAAAAARPQAPVAAPPKLAPAAAPKPVPSAPAQAPATAPATAPAAAAELPDKAQLLYIRVQVLLQYMQRNGYNAVSAEEARAVIGRMEKIVPGHARVSELRTLLQSLSPR